MILHGDGLDLGHGWPHRPRQDVADPRADRCRHRSAAGGEATRHHDRSGIRRTVRGRVSAGHRRRAGPRAVRAQHAGRRHGHGPGPAGRRRRRFDQAADARALRYSAAAESAGRRHRRHQVRPGGSRLDRIGGRRNPRLRARLVSRVGAAGAHQHDDRAGARSALRGTGGGGRAGRPSCAATAPRVAPFRMAIDRAFTVAGPRHGGDGQRQQWRSAGRRRAVDRAGRAACARPRAAEPRPAGRTGASWPTCGHQPGRCPS